MLLRLRGLGMRQEKNLDKFFLGVSVVCCALVSRL